MTSRKPDLHLHAEGTKSVSLPIFIVFKRGELAPGGAEEPVIHSVHRLARKATDIAEELDDSGEWVA